jgi:hypothetical protein
MSLLKMGTRVRQGLVGDTVRRGLVERDFFSIAANLADAPGENYIVLNTDPDADPRLAEVRLEDQNSRAMRLFLSQEFTEVDEPYPHIIIEV